MRKTRCAMDAKMHELHRSCSKHHVVRMKTVNTSPLLLLGNRGHPVSCFVFPLAVIVRDLETGRETEAAGNAMGLHLTMAGGGAGVGSRGGPGSSPTGPVSASLVPE